MRAKTKWVVAMVLMQAFRVLHRLAKWCLDCSLHIQRQITGGAYLYLPAAETIRAGDRVAWDAETGGVVRADAGRVKSGSHILCGWKAAADGRPGGR